MTNPMVTAAVASLTHSELEERRDEINARLLELGCCDDVLKKKPGTSNNKRPRNLHDNGKDGIILYDSKMDTHWDFLMKEMMWLGADFTAERKRQHGLAKKQANAVNQFHKTKESRRVRLLAEAELKRRRLSAKIGREVRGWWTKIERVIAYKQKLSADKERRKAMNKQLVELVRLTEQYGEKVVRQSETDGEFTSLTIEEALGAADRLRRKGPRDYANIEMMEPVFYGESTTEDSGSDGSFVVDSEEDDETTMKEAEAEETRERLKSRGSDAEDNGDAYIADPDELQKLQEESNMDIEELLERLRHETLDCEDVGMVHGVDEKAKEQAHVKRVTFAEGMKDHTSRGSTRSSQLPIPPQLWEPCPADQGFEADDDGDASDVEDFECNNDAQASDGSDEFQDDDNEVDDETTIAAEERLGREMSADEEINLLQQEGEMSIEELRKRYGLTDAAEQSVDNAELVQVDDQCEVSSRETAEDCETDTRQSPTESARIPAHMGDVVAMFDEDDAGDEDEFQPTQEVDDETTLEAEERLGRDMSYEDEIALLNKENEMSVEDLRKLYGFMGGDIQSDDDDIDPNTDSDATEGMNIEYDGDDGEEEFKLEEEPVDDETTMEAEERLGRDMSAEDEIALLKRESETPIEELRAMYNDMEMSSCVPVAKANGAHPVTNGMKRQRLNEEADDNDGIDALKALRESEERARSTLATRPFLLSNWVKLRKYQQTGLNWLVSTQTRRLNGILADEMGLGKTLQTISLLSYLASYKGIWGPHLVIVPTSVIINWETELKRFSPALKVLCYYGSAKRRKELRTGWTKANWYHVVITSYQLAVQDSFAFKRKKWYYMILDEAHNIKNFQSQRWQTLISFNSQRRLLLTGTPLQNNLTELWSLLHFLMPHVFRSRKEFSYWFSNPMNNIIEGNSQRSDELISRLHEIIRPFVLRRLKKDVETQLPGKYEHIVKCHMSRRQQFLYEEFMARSSTRQALKKGGNFMGMMNVLMQLRKVCNHPDLFEPRAVVTPFAMGGIDYFVPKIALAKQENAYGRTFSDYLGTPLWCGSSGLPCPSMCLDHDTLIASQLLRLTTPLHLFTESVNDASVDEPLPEEGTGEGLAMHLKQIWLSERRKKVDVNAFQSRINKQRCESHPFCYPHRLQRCVSLDTFPLDREDGDLVRNKEIVSTPHQLLEMRKSLRDRMDDADDLIKKFVFCVPKAGAAKPSMVAKCCEEKLAPSLSEMLREPAEEFLRPFQKAQARLSSFFPDKRLVQFDAGKLQSLSALLYGLKRGGHRALIFTQMSKMLDVLETFLNLNGHTYLRLDGSTGVDRRQRLMDKFNNDEKVFCFILSTRSGGLGINLTGADTVIFYDSDWNPAMDAQAQDRAHRIGQTRDVHIYRLITQHSIEENIFIKAKQKRNLDLIVMDEGKFDASNGAEEAEEGKDTLQDLYSNGGLLDILGVEGNGTVGQESDQQQNGMTSEQLEKAMASLEDADDAIAMQNAKKEAADELKEFDETVEYNTKDDEEDENKAPTEDKVNTTNMSETDEAMEKTTSDDDEKDESKREAEMVKEFNEWQNKVGVDADAIEASLSSTEKYALRFRETVDPFWSIFAIMEERRRIEAAEDDEEEVDIEALERENAYNEELALDEGDLLGTHPRPDELPRQRHVYQREKARVRASKKRRKLTGENWVERIDGLSQCPFWYDEDTGEAIWEKPKILLELEADMLAADKKWNAMPLKPLVLTMSFLVPSPERTTAALVCRQWKEAATDVSFVLHVLPVELGSTHGSRMLPNHFGTISDAVEAAQPGDTLELGDGHYWIKEPGLEMTFPLRFVGDENDPSHVVIELSGSFRFSGTCGFIEGVTLRRPKIASASSDEMLVVIGGRLDLLQCVLNNHGNDGNVASVSGAKCRWIGVVVQGSRKNSGLVAESQTSIYLDSCDVRSNHGSGIACAGGSQLTMTNCRVENNGDFGVLIRGSSKGEVTKCHFAGNGKGMIEKQAGCTCVPCSGNVAVLSASQRAPPGFRVIREEESDQLN